MSSCDPAGSRRTGSRIPQLQPALPRPLLKQVDSEAPSTVNVAFLRGPWHAPQLRNDIGKWLGVTSGEIETIFPNLEPFADPFTPGYDPTDYSTMLANANMDYLNGI